ncbi:MAG TPA: hypothetical protein VK630_15905 [Reyranella sp.]|nr:hypothetical protein [Reyranella sp.]
MSEDREERCICGHTFDEHSEDGEIEDALSCTVEGCDCLNFIDRAQLPAVASWSDATIRAVALDIAKAVAHHIETMYPAAVTATSRNMLVSVRGCVINEIMAAIAINDEGRIVRRLAKRKKHRAEIKRAYQRFRGD